MTDNLGPLRQAMSALAEHGGSTDMYERSLQKSRQLQRRARVAAAGAFAVTAFAVGGVVALTTANRPGPPAPAATQGPSPSVAPTPAVPSSTPPPSHSSTPTSNRPRYPACPAAKTLEKLTDLPKDWRFVPSSVKCWRNWATAEPEGPDVGDGVYLFQYKAGTGWRYHSQGSAFECEALGITTGNPPFCAMR